jgi:hypothetical protein
MKKVEAYNTSLVPTAYNVITGDPVKNVFFQLFKESC